MKHIWLLVALACVLAPAQDLTRKITLRAAAQSAPNLVKQLAAETGLSLKASDSVAKDVVLLKVHDVTAQEVLDRLAAVLGASWASRDGYLILTRTPKQEADEHAAERARRLADLRRYVKKTTAPLDDHPDLDGKATKQLVQDIGLLLDAYKENPDDETIQARGERIERRFPMERAIYKLLRAIDLSRLVELGYPGRIVFSTAPTKMEVPLGSAGDLVLRDLRDEQARFTGALKKSGVMTKMRVGEDDSDDGIDHLFKDFGKTTPRLVLAVSATSLYPNSPVSDAIDPTLFILDEQGALITQHRLVSGDFPEASSTLSHEDVPIVFSPAGKAMADRLRHTSYPPPPISQELLARLVSPTNEPLAAVPSDAVFSLADHFGVNAVAVVSDDAMTFSTEKNISLADLENDACEDITQANDWLTVKPKYPYSERRSRCDRAALARLLKAAASTPITLSSDTWAEAATHLPAPEESTLFWIHTKLFPNCGDPTASWSFLRFYGHLSPGQRSALLNGRKLDVSELSQEALAALFNAVFLDPTRLSSSPDDSDTDSIEREPMERLPNGIPSQASISAKVDIVAGVVGENANRTLGEVSPYFVASDRFAQLKGKPSEIAGFRPSQIRREAITIQLTPTLRLEDTIVDTAVGSSVAYDDLPADFKASVEQRVAALQKAASKQDAGKPPPSICGESSEPFHRKRYHESARTVTRVYLVSV